jgi:RNA polymerase sigma-70 factor (ECF subfamily)
MSKLLGVFSPYSIVFKAGKMILQSMAAAWGASVSVEDDLTRLRKGDLEALGGLIEQYQPRLYRYLLRLLHEPATAEDLFQQTWIRVAEKIKSYDPSRSFENWLFTVARNLALDHVRRYLPDSLDEPLPSGESRLELLASESPGAADELLEAERTALLASAMENLPLIFREVLSLRFEQDMKLEDIAVFLKIPLSTVKSRLRRALEGLRTILGNQLQQRTIE